MLCPYCGNQTHIQCQSCGKTLDEQKQLPWYWKKSTTITALLCAGPFALPLLWFSPVFRLRSKIIITLVVLSISWYLMRVFNSAFLSLRQISNQLL
jgi:hypothetical protein